MIIPELPSVLIGLRELVWPLLLDTPDTLLLNTGNVRQLSEAAFDDGINTNESSLQAPMSLSANRAEMRLLAAGFDTSSMSLSADAISVRDRLSLQRTLANADDYSLSAGPGGTDSVSLPRVDNPVITTSSGKQLNIGLMFRLVADSVIKGRDALPGDFDDFLAVPGV